MSAQDTKPHVQIPLGADYHGLTIDGEFITAYPDHLDHPGDENLDTELRDYLPERANDAYWNYYNTENLGTVYQCTDCGYLTTADALGPTAYRSYECGNDDCSNRTPKSTNDGFRKCKRRNAVVDLDTGEKTHITELDTDDVPNHPSHLGRLQTQLEGFVPRGKMMSIVADAVADAREQGHIDY